MFGIENQEGTAILRCTGSLRASSTEREVDLQCVPAPVSPCSSNPVGFSHLLVEHRFPIVELLARLRRVVSTASVAWSPYCASRHPGTAGVLPAPSRALSRSAPVSAAEFVSVTCAQACMILSSALSQRCPCSPLLSRCWEMQDDPTDRTLSFPCVICHALRRLWMLSRGVCLRLRCPLRRNLQRRDRREHRCTH